MNTAIGRAEKLPVDIRNRRFPIRYKLGPDNLAEAETVKLELAKDFRIAIDAILYQDHQAVNDAGKRFDSNCIQVVTANRGRPYFFMPPPNQVTFGSATGIDTLTINAAIPRLLDLGLIECDYDTRQNLYAYHWTFLGRMYIRQKWPNDIPPWIAEIDRQSPATGYDVATSPL
jgi:hypothetical protein